MADKHNISIKEIAKLAGVSIATVSRVMNKTGRYSKETEERVLAIIEQYGYVSNNAAKSLRVSESKTIGLILPNIKNNFFAALASTVEEFFSERDYSVFICNTSNNSEKERNYFKKLESQLVDGILVISGQNSISDNVTTRKIPMVLFDRFPANNMNLPVVCSDNYGGAFSATQLLIDRGCKNIVNINSHTAEYDRSQRRRGYQDCLSENGIVIDKKKILSVAFDRPSLEQGDLLITEYLQKGLPLDGIFCASDSVAIGAMNALKRAGLRIPEDVKVVGFDDSVSARIISPALTSVARNPEQMAVSACKKLLSLIQGTEDEIPDHLIIPVEVVERESTGYHIG